MKLLYRKYKAYVFITLITLCSTLILWLPFLIKTPTLNGINLSNINFEIVTKSWDGPLYIIPAKTFYNKDHALSIMSPLGLPHTYFAAHLPGYPITIALLAPFFGFVNGMLAATLAGAILLFNFFYYVLKKLNLTTHPFILTMVFLFFSPRLLVARSVGSPETFFMLFILASLFFFAKRQYLIASLFGGLSIITKSPGGLLFFAYALYFFAEYRTNRKFEMKWLWILLIPGAFLLLSLFYAMQIGDFWAYFNSGDNLHLLFPPFQVFNYQAPWVGTGWLEDVVFIYFFYGLTLMELLPAIFSNGVARITNFLNGFVENILHQKEKHDLKDAFFYFTLLMFVSIICVQHRDISRYSLPLLPIALVTFERFFTSRKFLIILVVLIPGIYMHAWNFMLTNTAPIADWAPFL